MIQIFWNSKYPNLGFNRQSGHTATTYLLEVIFIYIQLTSDRNIWASINSSTSYTFYTRNIHFVAELLNTKSEICASVFEKFLILALSADEMEITINVFFD